MRQREAEDRVARLQQRVVDGRVGLRAGVRLDVGVLGAEQRLRAVDRELLDHVDVLAAAVVALAGIALRVLVGQHAALALEDGLRHEVLRGDHLQRAPLAVQLAVQGLGDLGVDVGEGALEVVGLQVGHRRVSRFEWALDRTTGQASRRPRSMSRSGTAPWRSTAHIPSSSKRRRSTTVDGVPGQLAAVEHQVGAAADLLRDLVEPLRVEPAGEVGGALQHRPAHPRQRAIPGQRGDAQAERVRVRPAGEREAAQRVRQQRGDAAGQQPLEQRARARLELGQRGEGQLAVEEHDRGGLVRRGGP